MDGKTVFSSCPTCKYVRAQKTARKDKSYEHFICHRCGYLCLIDGKECKRHFGLGSWMILVENGIYASAIYLNSNDLENAIDGIKKIFAGGKLFYTKPDSAGGYLLVNSENGMKYPFGDDDEVCFEGLRKMPS